MLSVVLNRFILLGGRIVGIFLVLIGLLSCVPPQKSPTEPKVPENLSHNQGTPSKSQIKISQTKWWNEQHSDNKLLNNLVILDKCINRQRELIDNPATYKKVGALIHPFIRTFKWKAIFDGTESEDETSFSKYVKEKRQACLDGSTENCFSNSVGVSIVPYLEIDGGKKHLVAPEPDALSQEKEKFSYYVICEEESVAQKMLGQYPHYYSTILLTPTSSDSSQKKKLFDTLQTDKWNEVDSPIKLHNNSANNTLADLLERLFDDKKATFLQKIREQTVEVDVQGFTPPVFWKHQHNTNNLAGNPKISYESSTQPDNAPNANSTATPPAPTTPASPKVVTIKLPTDFVRMFNDAGINLTDKMEVEGCPNVTFTKQGQNSFVVDDCSNPTDLNITGFKLIRLQDTGNSTFSPTDNNIMAEVNISADRTYQLVSSDNTVSHSTSILDKRKDFSYKYIGKELSFKIDANSSSRCDRKVPITLQQVLKGNARLELKCSPVVLSWPAEWGKPTTKPAECDDFYETGWINNLFNKKKTTLSCNPTQMDITLNWGNKWQPVTIPVDQENEIYLTQHLDKFRANWPFDSRDTWLQQRGGSQSGGDPCTANPLYAIQTVSYSYQGGERGTPKPIKKEGNLPTLTEVSWSENDPLPDGITVTLKQQGRPITKKYQNEVKISLPISNKKTTLLALSQDNEYSAKFKPSPTRVSLLTDRLGSGAAGNYGVYRFRDRTSCRQSGDGNNGTKLVPQDNRLEIEPCQEAAYFKIFDDFNGKPVSRCAEPDRGQVVFEPYQCLGKRKLIVVALGNDLNQYYQSIKTAITKVLQQQVSSRTPFTLVTIQPGRIVGEPLLRCEDLDVGTAAEASRFISGQLGQMRFGATDLRTLQDLELVNYAYQTQLDQFSGVFYITDNRNMPTDEVNIGKQIVVPTVWHNKGIRLTVLTIGDTSACQIWKKAQADCQLLQLGRIETALQQFLSN